MNRQSQAVSIRQRLSNFAQQYGLSYQNVATTFLLERLVARITSNKDLHQSLVFKGGYVNLRVYQSVRYTTDVDALLFKSDLGKTLNTVKLSVEKYIDDGVWFKFEKEIDLKSQGEYGGIRQVYRSGIGGVPKNVKKAQIVHFDLGIGDPVLPLKMETPELIGKGELSWFVYPIETIIAEKIHAWVDRGKYNSRSKDIFDLAYLLEKADKNILNSAIDKCFTHRGTEIPENLVKHLESIDQSFLRKGWSSATSGIKEAQSFEDAYNKILNELKRLF